MPANPSAFRRLPGGIWALGLVSLCMDTSSELVHSILPLYLASVIGTSMAVIGLVEGIAEATALVTKMFSGALSDFLGRRKILILLGYGLAALTKPVFPLADTLGWVMFGRFVDRVGKGIRGAPRDALVADMTPPALRGAAYGLRQALDSIGAFLGPVLAVVFMAMFANDLQATLWAGVVPAFLAVAIIVVAVREPGEKQTAAGRPARFTLAGAGSLGLRYWLIVLLGMIFSLARFSEAFLVLRAQSVGLSLGQAPMVMIVMNLVYAAAAYPAGAAADRMSKRALLILGLAILILADLVLAAATSAGTVLLGGLLWGLHMALTQGLFAKLVADASPASLRGTAFGIFNLAGGVSLLLASVLAGTLWDRFGAPATFLAGAVFASLAALGLIAYRTRRPVDRIAG